MSAIQNALFPEISRTFKYKRWVKISLRTLHLIGMAVAVGGLTFHLSHDILWPYLLTMNLSGLAFILLEIWSNGIWLIQLRGIIIFLKLILIALLPLFPGLLPILLILIIIVSSVISHAPGDVRYFSPWHGKRMDTFYS